MIISSIQDFRSKIIYNPKQVKKLLGIQEIKIYELNKNNDFKKELKLLFENIYNKTQKIFIACGNESDEPNFAKEYINFSKDIKEDIFFNLEHINQFKKNNIILIVEIGKVKIDELLNFSSKLELLKVKVDALIIVDS